MEMIRRASQKTDVMTLPADGTVFAFFRADSPLSVHCFDCSFISDVKWWTHVSSMVINRRKKSYLLLWNIAKRSIETSSRCCFCSIVRKRITHLADCFLLSEISGNMRCTAFLSFCGFSSPFLTWSLHLVDHSDGIVSHNDDQFFLCLQIHWERSLLIAVKQILNNLASSNSLFKLYKVGAFDNSNFFSKNNCHLYVRSDTSGTTPVYYYKI